MFSKFLLLAGTALLLTGCVTDQGLTDRSGRSLSLDDEGGFEPSESRFNTFNFLEVSQKYSTQALERDNGRGWTEIVRWDGGKSYVLIQFVNTAWFGRSTEDHALDGEDFRKAAAKLGISEDNFQKIDQVSPRTKGWIAGNENCVAGLFAKRFKKATPYDNDRGYSDAVVEFGGCSQFAVSPEAMMQGINLISDKDEAKLVAAYSGIGSIKKNTWSPKTQNQTWTFNGTWDGVSSDITGEVKGKGAAQFDFSFVIAETNAACSGTAVTGKGTGNTGTWKLTCDNGSDANGIWTKHDGQPVKGGGVDNKKRRLSFEFQS